MSHRIRRVALALVTTAALAGCGAAVAPAPGNTPVPAPQAAPQAQDAAALRPAIAPLAVSKPVGLLVPAIGVDSAPLLDLGIDPAGKLEVPPDAKGVGWFDLSPTPGALGPAVIAAHVDYAGVLGPFHRLHELKAGDEITVRRADGSTAVFQAYDVERFAKETFPTERVYGDTAGAELRLITCGGVFDKASRQYKDNVVAFARLVGTA